MRFRSRVCSALLLTLCAGLLCSSVAQDAPIDPPPMPLPPADSAASDTSSPAAPAGAAPPVPVDPLPPSAPGLEEVEGGASPRQPRLASESSTSPTAPTVPMDKNDFSAFTDDMPATAPWKQSAEYFTQVFQPSNTLTFRLNYGETWDWIHEAGENRQDGDAPAQIRGNFFAVSETDPRIEFTIKDAEGEVVYELLDENSGDWKFDAKPQPYTIRFKNIGNEVCVVTFAWLEGEDADNPLFDKVRRRDALRSLIREQKAAAEAAAAANGTAPAVPAVDAATAAKNLGVESGSVLDEMERRIALIHRTFDRIAAEQQYLDVRHRRHLLTQESTRRRVQLFTLFEIIVTAVVVLLQTSIIKWMTTSERHDRSETTFFELITSFLVGSKRRPPTAAAAATAASSAHARARPNI